MKARIVKLKEDNNKLKMENVHLKKRIKREEEVRKHWQDTCKKKEEELGGVKKENEELKKNLDGEKQTSKKA